MNTTIEATRARLVLDACREALQDIYADPVGPKWRRTWVMTVALLRAVGHVLRNVDRERNPEMREAVDEYWHGLKSTKPEPQIFWQFIEDERNSVIKEYSFHAAQHTTIYAGSAWLDPKTGETGEAHPPGKTEYRYEMTSGPFKGRDQRELVSEAIEWWEIEIEHIETRAEAIRLMNEGHV